MNKLFRGPAIIIMISAILLTIPSVARADAFVGRVFNGDLEQNPMGFGWHTSYSGSASNDIASWGAGNAHSGTRSDRMVAYGNSISVLQQAVEVKEKTYRFDFSFWYKVTGPDASGPFAPVIDYQVKSMTKPYEPLVTGCDASIENITKPGPSDQRGDWRQATCMFERYKGEEFQPDSYVLFISMESWTSGVQLYVDDVSVITRQYDRIPPVLYLTSPVWGSTVITSAVQIAGSASDIETGLQSVEVDPSNNGKWIPVTVDSKGDFSVNLTLSPGKNVIPFRATDNGQNITWRYYEMTYQPGVVLGVATVQPMVTTLTASSGKMTIGSGSQRKTLTPFSGYHGDLWARRVKTDDGSVFYVVATTKSNTHGGMKVFNAAGKLVQTLNPFGSFKPGYNLTMSIDRATNRIFLAVAPRRYGSNVTIDEFTNGQLRFVATLPVTTLLGNVRTKFVSAGNDPLRLVTVVDGKMKTLKVWEFSSTRNAFQRDLSFDTRRVRVTSSSISLLN
ncbi:MAG: hypothetical protein V1685_03470 [Parcubacteria group bacterium]